MQHYAACSYSNDDRWDFYEAVNLGVDGRKPAFKRWHFLQRNFKHSFGGDAASPDADGNEVINKTAVIMPLRIRGFVAD